MTVLGKRGVMEERPWTVSGQRDHRIQPLRILSRLKFVREPVSVFDGLGNFVHGKSDREHRDLPCF